jgi:hypothetical protein
LKEIGKKWLPDDVNKGSCEYVSTTQDWFSVFDLVPEYFAKDIALKIHVPVLKSPL